MTGFIICTQLLIKWILGATSVEVMRPRRESDHSPATSDRVKETPQYAFMAYCLISYAQGQL
jgi:hypothetical protein